MRIRNRIALGVMALLLPMAAGCGKDSGPSAPPNTSSGVKPFVRLVSGTSGDVAYGLTVASNGDRVIVGGFTGSAQFENPFVYGAPMADSLSGNGGPDIFAVGYKADGTRAWERNLGGTGDDIATSATADGAGNIYITGVFSGTAQFGATQLVSAGGADVVVVKLDANHDPVWAFGGGGTNYDQPWRIARDNAGNLIFTGSYSTAATFGSTPLTSNGLSDAIVVKLSSSGGVVWAKSLGGADYDDCFGIATDASNNIYVAGTYSDSTDFGGTKLGTTGHSCSFVAKYNSAGTLQWVRPGRGTGSVQGLGIALVGDRVCVTGIFEGDLTVGTSQVTSAGDDDISVACYSLDGTLLWLRRYGGVGSDNAFDVVSAGGNSVYIAGTFSQVVDFGTTQLTTNGSIDAFIARLDPTGAATLAEGYGGTFEDAGISLAIADGHAVLSGYTTGAASFNGMVVTGNGQLDAFIFQR